MLELPKITQKQKVADDIFDCDADPIKPPKPVMDKQPSLVMLPQKPLNKDDTVSSFFMPTEITPKTTFARNSNTLRTLSTSMTAI